MSRFVDPTELKQIDLGDGDWVKIPARVSWEIAEDFTTSELPEGKKGILMLRTFIKEWNLKDKEGNIPKITEENIKKLDLPTLNKIGDEIGTLIEMDVDVKKKKTKAE